MAFCSVFCALIIVVVIVLWIYGIKDYNYWDKCGVFNKKPFFPFMGNIKLNQFFKSNLQMVQGLYESMSGQPYGGIYFLSSPALVVRDPEIIKSILVTDFNHFVNRGFNCNPGCDPVAHNMIHLTGKSWKYARSKLQPCFGSNKMKLLIPEIDKLAVEVCEQIEQDNPDRKPISFDVSDLIDRYMIDAITFSSYGIKSNTIKDREKSEIYNIAGDAFGGHHFMFHMFVGFLFPRFHKFIRMTTTPKHVIKFFLDLTKKISALRSNKIENDRKNFFDTLVRMANDKNKESRINETEEQSVNDEFDDKEILNQEEETGVFDENFVAANTFIIFSAGYDASSKIASFSLFEIAYNEDIQNKAREEILRVLSETNGKITLEALQKMTYLEQIIAETNRKYPMLSILFRKCVKRYEMPDGGIIEPDIPVMIPSSAIHYDPAYFPEPYKYDPERFNDVNKLNIHPATHIPFGMGPRICLAYQFAVAVIKTILTRILFKYRISLHESCKQYPIKLQPKSFLLSPEKHIILNAIEI